MYCDVLWAKIHCPMQCAYTYELFGSMDNRMNSIFASDLILQNVKLILVMVCWSFLVFQTYSSEYSHAYNFISSLSQKLIPFQMIYNTACELTLRHMKCPLCTCGYAYIWYFRHPFLLPLRWSSILHEWKSSGYDQQLLTLLVRTDVMVLWGHSPSWVCFWLLLCLLLSYFSSFSSNDSTVCSPSTVPCMRAVWLKVAEKNTLQKQFSEMVEVSSQEWIVCSSDFLNL